MARTQKNKATSGHLGLLKAKLAKLRRELIEPKGSSGATGEGFDVAKTGDARIGFVGEYICTSKLLLNSFFNENTSNPLICKLVNQGVVVKSPVCKYMK